MRRLFALAVVMSLAFASVAAGAGKLPYDRSRVGIQNLTGSAPDPATPTCATLTATKGTIATVTTTGYVALFWKAVDAAGAALNVKRFIGSNTAYMPESGGPLVNPGGNAFSSVLFKKYSTGTATTATVCYELQ
jgi:hypothetical protein